MKINDLRSEKGVKTWKSLKLGVDLLNGRSFKLGESYNNDSEIIILNAEVTVR
jgi:hypothetical protein